MLGYRRRIERDLQRWRERGWVTPTGAEAIRTELAASGRGLNLAGALGTLGVVLIGFAAMSFVAANWQEMSRLARLGLLLAGLWASYGAAGVLHERHLTRFADAAVLLGSSIFGASIMLISQMYHMDGNPPDAVLVWTLGTLLAGVACRSNPTLALAMLLAMLWGGWEIVLRLTTYYPFLVVWALISAAFVWRGWRPGVHLSAIALSGWIISLGFVLFKYDQHQLVVGLGLAVALLGAYGGLLLPAIRNEEHMLVGYGGGVAFIGLFAMQFIEPIPAGGGKMLVLAILTLALLVAAIVWAFRRGHRPVLWLAYGALSAEILSVYFKTIGTLMGSSVFFLTAGLVVMALAFLAYRLHAHEAAKMVRP